MYFAKSMLIGGGRLIAFICISTLLIPYYLFGMCISVVMAAAGDDEIAEKWFGYISKVMDFTVVKCGLDW